MKSRIVLLWAFALAALVAAFAGNAWAFKPPPIAGHITDTAGKLNDAERARLESQLERFRHESGHEIAVFVVGSLEGEPIDDVAYDTFNMWRLGRGSLDDGVLLVIAPTERQVRIETGKGVGGELTDIESFHILRNDVEPYLKENRFYDAVTHGTDAIASALGNDASSPGTPSNGVPERPAPRNLPYGFVGVLVVLILLRLIFGRRGGFWIFPGGGFGGGGGFFRGGGGGGGGFSGGGGSSGGGGASDRY